MKFPAIIFDLDGTLLNTLDDIVFSMNAALTKLGASPHPAHDYRRFVGQGLDMLALLVLPENRRDEATVRQCVIAMREVYAGRWAHATRPYAGVSDMLSSLRQAGVRCAVCSNKAHDFTVKIVTHYFGTDNFEMVLGAGTFAPKPDPAGVLHIATALGIAPRDFLYVGDSDIDMKTAGRAGMYPVGVTWGFRSKEELLENGARLIVDNPGEIITKALG
jgi:phosphoglycolate phosphatase